MIVIDRQVVAAAVRRPAEIVGDGRHTVTELVRVHQPAARARPPAASRGSRWTTITAEVVAEAGYAMDDVPPNGQRIRVRRTANLHTGGTIEDVTARLHPEIADAAVRAADGARHPGDRPGLPGARRRGPGLRVHRGQRAARAGQPRAAAGRRAVRRPALPRDPPPLTAHSRAVIYLLRRARRRPGCAGPLGRSPRRCRTPPAAGPGRRCWSTSPAAC